ncbi:hypothetical protein AGMMS49960_03600 [Betaproteobacteria bacterium]|nr:hypothetical protein AGMMS49543_02400 [Betaproteobacteria bacterium]GHT99122.1 hypothetical protein AGMMS49960_03600 [Betaproteobacteria bacterium]GHU24581.1 hypothetical protein AGMMS50243_27870 [Betaproteobacteria bacterium]
MADNSLNTAVVITTQTEGDDKIKALVGELRSLAATAGDAAPAFTALADEMESLNRQNALVAKFAELKRQLTDTEAMCAINAGWGGRGCRPKGGDGCGGRVRIGLVWLRTGLHL